MKELDALIDEMAIKYKVDKKCDDDAAKAQLREKMSAAETKMHGTTVSPLSSNFNSRSFCIRHFNSGGSILEQGCYRHPQIWRSSLPNSVGQNFVTVMY